jgi:hypothetical protein
VKLKLFCDYGKLKPQLDRIEKLLLDERKKEKQDMSQITDWATKEQASLTSISSTLDGIVTGVTALDELITRFQNSPGTLSVEDQTALDAIQAASQALVTKSAAIVVTPPSPVSPVPAPPLAP